MTEWSDDNRQPSVVVVDDSDEASLILRRVLENEGFHVRLASNGRAALQMIFAEPPDLVLLDVMMPSMDGLEVLRTLRESPETAELPVIMVTALGDIQDVVTGLEMGANDYITKPPQLEILVARARTQIKLKRLQDQRRRDLQRLRELNAIKDTFLQIAAHDLKNPLNNIIMGIEVLDKGDETWQADSTQAEIIDMIRAAAYMMYSIVNDFLDLQALQSGQIELSLQTVSLNDVIEEVVRQFRPYAARKDVLLQAEPAPDLPLCVADPDRLSQVCSNLLSNAIKFSPRGGEVIIRTLSNEDVVRVEVRDNGPGIPEEEIPLLFQSFARLSNQPTGGERSSGLGLAITRQLVELHGGIIGVESSEGAGSLFWFELPCEGPGAV
nr:response regulator [Chloroflexota bacterium]